MEFIILLFIICVFITMKRFSLFNFVEDINTNINNVPIGNNKNNNIQVGVFMYYVNLVNQGVI